MKIPLILPTGSTQGRSGQVANARLVNAYAEPSGKDGKSSFAVYAAPGLRRWDTGSYAGACRGLIQRDSNSLIAILGNEVVDFDQAGNGTLLGSIVGSERLHLSRNRAATPQITMKTESREVYHLAGTSIAKNTDADLPAPESHGYLSGFTLYGILDGRIFASDLEDSSAISAGAFGNSKADDSNLIRVFPDSNYAYVFNEKGTEIWRPNENAPNPDFLFSPTQQNLNIGCGAPHSVTSIPGRGIAWVDNENIVRLGQGTSSTRISSHTVEREIERLSDAQRFGIYGYYYTFQGHEIYQLVSALWTWELSLSYGEWFQRETYGRSRFRAQAHELFNGLHIVGNDQDGKLYSIDPDTYADGDDPLVMEIICAHSHNFPEAMTVERLEVDVIGGVGLQTGAASDVNPMLMIDYSDDGGETFEGERTVSIGQIGERQIKVNEDQWGYVDNPGRLWRFRVSANVLKGIIGATLYGSKAG